MERQGPRSEKGVCVTRSNGGQVDMRGLCEGLAVNPGWDQSRLEALAHEGCLQWERGSNSSHELQQGWPASVSRGDGPAISRVLKGSHSPSSERQSLLGPLMT